MLKKKHFFKKTTYVYLDRFHYFDIKIKPNSKYQLFN